MHIFKTVLAMIMTCMLQLPATSSAAEEIRFAISIPDINRPSTTIAQKILQYAYARLGIKLDFIATPGVRAQAMWSSGQLDGIAVRVIDGGLPDSIKIPVPIVLEESVVYTIDKKFVVNGYDSLNPYLIGYISGFPYLEERLKNAPRKEHAPNLESLFRKLEVGRTEIAVESRFSSCLTHKLGFHNITMLEPSLEKVYGYHVLHIKHKQIAPALELVLKNMEKDGVIKNIQDEIMRDYMAQCS